MQISWCCCCCLRENDTTQEKKKKPKYAHSIIKIACLRRFRICPVVTIVGLSVSQISAVRDDLYMVENIYCQQFKIGQKKLYFMNNKFISFR